MQNKLIARSAKLLTETKKGRRKGVAITYEHIPKDLDERNHGSLYAVIHVNAPVAEAQEIIELVIEAFHGEYYQDINREPLLSFEAALSKINEELADITHQGKISWLNNLDAILAVLTGTTLHVTKAGKTEAFLYRGEKQSHVSEDLSGDVINPLRTFINIASGEMYEGDKIAIATPGTFYHLSKNELQKIVQGSQPRVAINQIADILEGTAAEVNPNAILILEAITPEAASNEVADEPDEVWISEPTKPVETAIKGAAPYALKFINFIKIGFIGIIAFSSEVVVPQLAKRIPALKKFATNRGKVSKSHEKILADTEESLNFSDENVEDLALKESEEIIGRDEYETQKPKANEFYIREDRKQLKWLNLERVNFNNLSNLSGKSKKKFRKLIANRKYLVVGIVVALLLLSGGMLFAYKTNSNSKNVKVSESSLNEAQGRYEAGKSALEEGDNLKAASILREALVSAQDLAKNKDYEKEANELVNKIKSLLDEAEAVTRVNPDVFADAESIVGSDCLGPYLIGSSLYLINKENGSIAEVNLANGEVATVLDKPDTGKVNAATAVVKRSILVLATKSEIYEFDTKEGTIKKQDIQGELEEIIAMTSFLTNIYSLDASGNVYKRLKTSTGYAKRFSYITDGTKAEAAVSLATDSSMYCLTAEGEIVKYLSGKKQTFSTEFPFAIKGGNGLYTVEDLDMLYFIDSQANRVVSVKTSGEFEKQYVSDRFSNLKGVTVQKTKIYILSGGKVYQLNKN